MSIRMTSASQVLSSGVDAVSTEHPSPRVIAGIEGLRACVGTDLGVSSWLTVEQSAVDSFAEVTGDDQWIHIDQTRAKDGPFGGTVAHGFLTLALSCGLMWEVASVDGVSAVINYGVNKVRFPAPVLVGSRVRMHVAVTEVSDVKGGVEVVYHMTYETEGQAKPPCVADLVFRYYA
jgi:acyl dehydratase